MPKLIIPNAYELYQPLDVQLSVDDIKTRQFYSLRFLWCLRPGDIILLPALPTRKFLSYFAYMNKIDLDSVTILVLEKKFNASISSALMDPNLIKELKRRIMHPDDWTIQVCFFNQAVLKLVLNLKIPLEPTWQKIILQDYCQQANSKARFRQLAVTHSVPITQGQLCETYETFLSAIIYFLKTTGQIIIKQNWNAGARGNIGIANFPQAQFVGVAAKIILNPKLNNLAVTALKIWNEYTNAFNSHLIVEIYYPNTGTFTAQIFIPPSPKLPSLINYCEIRMERSWIGVQIPAHALTRLQVNNLIAHSMRLADILQKDGYQGFICCDAIRTMEGSFLFTEINVRPGAEINAHCFAEHFFGSDYLQLVTILTRRNLKVRSFSSSYKILEKHHMLLQPDGRSGVVFLTFLADHWQQVEFLIAAPNLTSAEQLENKLVLLL